MIGWERRVLLRHYLEQGMTKTAAAEPPTGGGGGSFAPPIPYVVARFPSVTTWSVKARDPLRRTGVGEGGVARHHTGQREGP